MRALIAFLLLSFTPAFAVPVKVAEAPFNNLALTIQAIQTAKSYLLVNIYDLSSQDVADALVDRIKDGLHVEILEEGQPVGGVSAGGKKIRAQLAKAMAQAGGEDHLYVMSSKPVTNSFSAPSLSKRRFRFDHAKYIVVDGKDLLVGSENYSPTGNPVPGNLGNRGWEVLVHDDSIAGYFKDIFRKDSDTSIGDVVDLTDRSQLVDARTGEDVVGQAFVMADIEQLKRIARSLPVIEADDIKPVVSPDTSERALLSLLKNAQKSIEIQQMTFDYRWKTDDVQSPLLTAVIAAARRGVKVRVLLNDETVFNHGDPGARQVNGTTVDILNKLAKKERLDVEARIADVKAMEVDYIHNKGLLIDDEITLVSSINWGQNAVENNREAAVAIKSAEVNAHYRAIFDRDWEASDDR